MRPLTAWERLGRAVRDRSFIAGSILVVLFVLVAVLGPEVAPHNPYRRDRIQYIDGELYRAPIPPCDLYLLGTDDQGRDLLSLLLYGARQTLVIAAVATTVRLLLGLMLGMLSGWWPGSLFDRAVTTLTEFMAAVPGLILAALLVFAIGIRRGQVSFIVALSLVGWGEVSQIVRGHVLGIRRRLFVDAARAIGLSAVQILSRHVLPNLLGALLALSALEMAGVLLLLGELGFIHVFIGGGGRYVDEALQQAVHYFEVPDWGAMLGTSWRYFRGLPWLPMVPALAFFVTILGFNLFGYGLQRFVERGRFHPSGWSVLRFFVVAALILVGARAMLASVGIEAHFTRLARQFDVQRAWNHVSFLTQPDLQGRPSGPGPGYLAAGYIAGRFQEAGLSPLLTNGSYFQSYVTYRGLVTTPPTLEVLGADGGPGLRIAGGLSFDPRQPSQVEGSVEAEVVVVGNLRRGSASAVPFSEVLLLLDPAEELPSVWSRTLPYTAVIRVVPDDEVMPEDVAPAVSMPRFLDPFPNLLIGESAARELLAEAGLDLDALRAAMESGERLILPTGLWVRLACGVVYEEVTAVNVLGYLAAADIATQGERIMVAATYTGASPRGGQVYPGADDNASGVAVMLEVAQLWHDLGFEPRRTVVFAALDQGGGEYFVNHPALSTGTEDTWTVVVLHGLGAGQPALARYELGGYGLAHVLEQSGRRFGVRTEEAPPWPFFFVSQHGRSFPATVHPAYSGVVVTRPGDDLSGTAADTLTHLDPQLLAEAGQVAAHYLMVLSDR